MKSISITIVLTVFCVTFSSTIAYGFPDTCIPGTCNGDLKDNSGVKKGTFSNWAFRADTTTDGQWEYTVGLGNIQSNDANGTYSYNPGVSAAATYTGTANFPSHPEYGTSAYTMELTLTFDEQGYCQGSWIIDFASEQWTDMEGLWKHTSRYYAPITNHAYGVCIDSGLDYDEPDDDNVTYEFDLEIGTDDTVNLVRVTTPGTEGISSGITFDIPNLTDQWDDVNQVYTTYEYDPCENMYCWEYGKNAFIPDELDCYGDGWYDITVFYSGGGSDSTRIWFSVPADTIPISQPTQEPNFCNFMNRDRLESPVTFEWNLCEDSNATSIWLCFEKMLSDEESEIEFSITDTNSGPLDFNDGYWEADITFDHWYDVARNADGLAYSVSKCSESDYYFGIGILAEIAGDNIVNFEDFARFAKSWLDCDCEDWNLYCDRADLNFDNEVNYDDLMIMSEDWLAEFE